VVIENWRPVGLNELIRLHWAARSRRLKADYARVFAACFDAGVTRAKGKRRVSLAFVLKGQDKVRDEDNAWKGLLDGLTHAGAIVDDSPDWVERGGVLNGRGQARRTVINLEDLT
jgi:Holliday junction resolvase RusA-like endonuclease